MSAIERIYNAILAVIGQVSEWAKAASGSASAAAKSAETAGSSATAAAGSASDAAKSASGASTSAGAAAESKKGAEGWAKAAESWAVGGTKTRQGEDTDNAKYYAGQAGTDAETASAGAKVVTDNKVALDAVEKNLDAIQGAAGNAQAAQKAAEAAETDAARAKDAADKAVEIVGFDPDTKQDDLAEELNTVTLTNSAVYPLNNSQKSVTLKTKRTSRNYTVEAHLTGVTLPDGIQMTGDTAGVAGNIVISDKLVNGFKVKYTGAAKAATVELIVRGGMG